MGQGGRIVGWHSPGTAVWMSLPSCMLSAKPEALGLGGGDWSESLQAFGFWIAGNWERCCSLAMPHAPGSGGGR